VLKAANSLWLIIACPVSGVEWSSNAALSQGATYRFAVRHAGTERLHDTPERRAGVPDGERKSCGMPVRENPRCTTLTNLHTDLE